MYFVMIVFIFIVNLVWYKNLQKLNLEWYHECLRIIDDYSDKMAKILDGENDDEEETDE